jgi:Xaa-Pro aminopeptidase
VQALRTAGKSIPAPRDPRTFLIDFLPVVPGGPIDRSANAGELVLMDLSCRIDGYWSDTTNTHVMGRRDATRRQRRLVAGAQAAFNAAIESLRPGRRASEVWRAADEANRRLGLETPHYLGHQLGVAVNENPRLVAYDETVIQAGMVFAVESGAYDVPGGKEGVRYEKNVVITETGAEIISAFDWGL